MSYPIRMIARCPDCGARMQVDIERLPALTRTRLRTVIDIGFLVLLALLMVSVIVTTFIR